METLIMLGQPFDRDNPPVYAAGLDIQQLLRHATKDGLYLRLGYGDQCDVLGYLLFISELRSDGLYDLDHRDHDLAKRVRHARKLWNARFPGEVAEVLIMVQ